MARYTESVCKLCRREGEKLFLKGQKCVEKCIFEKRPYAPGEHGRRRRKVSEYSLQLREKQKAKRFYGVLEKQFRKTYDLAAKQKGITGENLMRLLETRLDNVVYRAGFAASRKEARQFVCHGHIIVDGKKVNIPSYQLKESQEIGIKDKSKANVPRFISISQGQILQESPAWLDTNYKELKTVVKVFPTREEVQSTAHEKQIVELYSK